MKIARFFAGTFGVIGLVLMLGTVGLCFASLDAEPKVASLSQKAVDCSQTVLDAISAGDFAAAAEDMYGQPDLGLAREPATPEAAAIWQAYRERITWDFQGQPYATSRGYARDAALYVLDIPALTAAVDLHARAILNDRVEKAETMEELYDENGDFRADLIDAVMAQALETALAEAREPQYCATTVEMIHRDGRWWVLPDEALLKVLGGCLEQE